MLVTAVEPRKRSLCAIYIDGEYALSLDAATVKEEGVRAGTEFDDDRLHELIIKSDLHRAKERALYLLSFRDHTRKELIDKIKRDSSEDAAEQAVQRMEELGLIDDEKYAFKYARELTLNKKLSRRAAYYKMLQKGLDRDLCEQALDEADADPHEQIMELLERKYSKKLESEKGVRQTCAALQRMGYSYSDIRAAIDEFTEDWTEADEL